MNPKRFERALWTYDGDHEDPCNGEVLPEEEARELLQENQDLLRSLKEHHDESIMVCYPGRVLKESVEAHRITDPDCETCALIARAEEAEYAGD